MTKDKTQELLDKYPLIFSELQLRKEDEDNPIKRGDTPLAQRGIECGDGWFIIIDEMCKKIDLISKRIGFKIICTQCKQKWNILTFYHKLEWLRETEDADAGIWADVVKSLVAMAQLQSQNMCERCGENVPSGYIRCPSKTCYTESITP